MKLSKTLLLATMLSALALPLTVAAAQAPEDGARPHAFRSGEHGRPNAEGEGDRFDHRGPHRGFGRWSEGDGFDGFRHRGPHGGFGRRGFRHGGFREGGFGHDEPMGGRFHVGRGEGREDEERGKGGPRDGGAMRRHGGDGKVRGQDRGGQDRSGQDRGGHDQGDSGSHDGGRHDRGGGDK